MKGLTAWFARNGVVANLLMFLIIAVGLLTTTGLRMEVFPEISVDIITVSVEYRGAAPEEVEEGVCVRVEEAVQDLDGIKKTHLLGVGRQGYGQHRGGDRLRHAQDRSTTSNPASTPSTPSRKRPNKPVIQEVTNRSQVINVSIAGDTDELTLKRLGEKVRDELTLLPEITQVELKNARPYEISIEVSEEALRRYGLTFDDVAHAVRRTSLDLPGGSVKTASGEILLRTKGQAYRGPEFENLTLLTRPRRQPRCSFRDVAHGRRRLRGHRPGRAPRRQALGAGAGLSASATRTRSTLSPPSRNTSRTCARGCPKASRSPPGPIRPRFLQSRMDLLIRNALSGLILVFIILALFLRLRLAFWVTLGIPISFLGTLAHDARAGRLDQHDLAVLLHPRARHRGGRRDRGGREHLSSRRKNTIGAERARSRARSRSRSRSSSAS